MFTLTDEYIKNLVAKSAFVEFFVVPLALAFTFPFAILILLYAQIQIVMKGIIIATIFGTAAILVASLRKNKIERIRKSVECSKYIQARLYYADYYGTTKKFSRRSIKYYFVYRDENCVNRMMQISADEYERLQNKTERDNGVIVLQYLTYNKKKYLYAAFDADNFVNESSIPIENPERKED